MMSSLLGRAVLVLIAVMGGKDISEAQVALESEPETPPVFRETIDWQRVIRGFRHDHNFALSMSYVQNEYKGYLKRTSEPFSAKTNALEMQVDYSFHLALRSNFGYTLGTGAGWILQEKASNSDIFRVDRSYSLPGISIGLVWNITERWRTAGTFTYGWQRIERLNLKTTFSSENIAVTGDVRSFRWALDYFYQLGYAVRIQLEQSDFYYSSEERFDIEKSGRQIQLGIVKHLL